VVVVTRSLPRDKVKRNSMETQQSPQGLDQRSKIKEVVPKIALQRGSDVGQFHLT